MNDVVVTDRQTPGTDLRIATADFAPLPTSFYDRPTTEVARDLLGRLLIHRTDIGETAGVIVETEAYGEDDPASHAFKGLKPLNATMFGPPGHAYVYLSYGVNWCLNAVTRDAGIGEAVLIRALEPVAGIDHMRARRGVDDIRRLCKGPGCLTAALGITIAQNGADLTGPELIIAGDQPQDLRITQTPRVGITLAADRLWRFCIADSAFLSRSRGTRRSLSQSNRRMP